MVDEVLFGDESGCYAWEMGLEELWEEGGRVRGKSCKMAGGCEEGASEGVVSGGDGDEHEGTGGPDVEMVRGDDESGVRGGINPEFAPEGIDVGLCVVDAGVFHHVVACGGVGAVGADEEVEIYGDFWGSLGGGFLGGVLGMNCSVGILLFEPGRLLFEIGTGKLVIEMQGYVRHFL